MSKISLCTVIYCAYQGRIQTKTKGGGLQIDHPLNGGVNFEKKQGILGIFRGGGGYRHQKKPWIRPCIMINVYTCYK